MTSFVELIRTVVRHELAGVRLGSLGVVTAVHPHEGEEDSANDEVSVMLKHEGLSLPRVPVAVAHPGVVAPLKEGDLVHVQFLEGDLQQALVTACFHHADERPPLHATGDLVLEHRVLADGTRDQLRFAADGGFRLDREVTADGSEASATIEISAEGDLTLRCGDDATVVVTRSDGTVAVTCSTLTVTGDVVVEDGDLTISDGKVTMSQGGSTTEISGNKLSGS